MRDEIGALGVGRTVAGEALARLGSGSLTPGFFLLRKKVISEGTPMVN
jgi:hypothetical protein